jgi:hypothetical protein
MGEPELKGRNKKSRVRVARGIELDGKIFSVRNGDLIAARC